MLTEHICPYSIGQCLLSFHPRDQTHCFQWIDYEFIRTKRNPVLSFASSDFKRLLRSIIATVMVCSTTITDQSIHSVDKLFNIIFPIRHLLTFMGVLLQLPLVQSVGGDDDLKSHIQPFDGVISSFTPWLIAFTALIAWKKPALSVIINGTSTRPQPVDQNNPTAIERKRMTAWDLRNTQLYGAIVSYVVPTIQASLHVDSMHDGVAALKYLKSRYGAQSTGDRAEATARLQRSHIDAQAKISSDDITKQYNEMSLAANDIVASNGPRPLMTA